MELRELEYIDLVREYADEFNPDTPVAEVINKLVKDNLINKSALRNRSLLVKYDRAIKLSEDTMRKIVNDLGTIYRLSRRMIYHIVSAR